jgi:hypothetical protein
VEVLVGDLLAMNTGERRGPAMHLIL